MKRVEKSRQTIEEYYSKLRVGWFDRKLLKIVVFQRKMQRRKRTHTTKSAVGLVKLKSHCKESAFLLETGDGEEGSIFRITDRISDMEPTPELGGSVVLPRGDREPSSGELGADFLRNGFHNLSTMLTCEVGEVEFWCSDDNEARFSDTRFKGCQIEKALTNKHKNRSTKLEFYYEEGVLGMDLMTVTIGVQYSLLTHILKI